MNNKQLLEERLIQIAKTLDSIEDFIDDLDIPVPRAAKDLIKKTIYSKEITEIVEGIKKKRPPRLALIGRSGVGKSSLINAITGSYLAETSAVDVGTDDADLFQYKENGETVFEIIDTRGFKENIQEKESSAEADLVKAIAEFSPDAFLMLNNGSDRSTLREDAKLVKELSEQINIEIPIITVVNRIDELEPSRIKEAAEYNQNKLNNINDKKRQVEAVLKEMKISDPVVIPVSSYIEWNHESPETLSAKEQAELTIEFDGRYNIEELIEYLEENIDFHAAIHMMLHHRIDQAIEKIANRFVKVFSAASATVALTPLPASDVFVLIPIQILQVNLIAYLNGIKLDMKAAREFIAGLGGVALFGLGLRFVAQQGAKFVNIVIPGGGSVVSSTIAYSGTYAIGKAAILYYIKDKSKEEVKSEVRKIEALQNEDEQEKLEVNEEVIIKNKQIETADKEEEKELTHIEIIEENETKKDKENKIKKLFSRLKFKKQKEEK